MLEAHYRDMNAAKKGRKKPGRLFSDLQKKILIEAVKRAEKKFKREGLTQEELAKALDLTQPSVSRLKNGAWTPGLTTARYIAQLEGKTLEDLIGPVKLDEDVAPESHALLLGGRFANLEVCVRFHDGSRSWSPWTLAAARAGFFGDKDMHPGEWVPKLDALELSFSQAKK